MNISREEAVRFLECATRNWAIVPPLSEDDIGDVASELLRFVIAKTKAEATTSATAERDAMKETLDQIHAIHRAFGAPGDYGYATREGKALYGLYRAGNALQSRLNGDGR